MRWFRWKICRRAADVFAAATVLGALLSWTAPTWAWPLSSALHFFEASFAVWIAGALLAWSGGRIGWLAAHVGLLGLWIALVSPRFDGAREAPQRDQVVRVATFNVGNGRATPEELCNALVELDADLVLLQELDDAQAAAVARRGAELGEHRVLRPAGRRGKAVLSRFPLENVELITCADGATRLEGVALTPRGPLAFVNVHARATAAFLGGWTGIDEQVSDVVSAAPADMPVIVAGDFNVGPNSELLRPLEHAGFANAFERCGQGLGLTFPVFGRYRGLPLPPLARIDHVFARGVEPLAARLGPSAGSDHRSLVVELRWPADRGP